MAIKRLKARFLVGGVLVLTAGVCWAWAPGRMTGGGSVFTDNAVRVTHGFELHCGLEGANGNITIPTPNNLEVNWEGHQFHLGTLTFSDCSNSNPYVNPAPPQSPLFNTLWGKGTGTLDGVAGATIDFVFRDYGEPGINDTAQYVITAPDGKTYPLVVSERKLTFGNHQAHAN
jgi:hypothetical protein